MYFNPNVRIERPAHTSARVVGDCIAEKPSARTPNNGGGLVLCKFGLF